MDLAVKIGEVMAGDTSPAEATTLSHIDVCLLLDWSPTPLVSGWYGDEVNIAQDPGAYILLDTMLGIGVEFTCQIGAMRAENSDFEVSHYLGRPYMVTLNLGEEV